MNRATVTLHDPTSETTPVMRPRRTPPRSLAHRTVVLFDIGKPRSAEFLDHVERWLADKGVRVTRFAKPTNAKAATSRILDDIAAQADVVVEALAD